MEENELVCLCALLEKAENDKSVRIDNPQAFLFACGFGVKVACDVTTSRN